MNFMDLIREGHLIQGMIALGSVAAIIYLAVTQQPVPEVLVATSSAIIGYYFSVGAQVSAERRAMKAMKG